ncbi:hypothetical protein FOCC_FOCC006444 [Frankliniella occidentalis]|nr:hypothetical protein FOCC_FOCC006444 [Frankliniella occidentalis]
MIPEDERVEVFADDEGEHSEHAKVRDLIGAGEAADADDLAANDAAPPPPKVPRLDKCTSNVRHPQHQPQDEVDQYMAMTATVAPDQLLTWWKMMDRPDGLPKLAKLAKRKLWITSQQAFERLAAGTYKLKDPPTSWPADCWKSFRLVVDANTDADTKNVQCQRCFKCMAFNEGDSGNSSLTKHLNQSCRVRLPSSDPARRVIVPKRIKDVLVDKLAEKCARDLSSLNSTVGVGMTGVVQAALDIGSACPGAQAVDIMPSASTVRQRLCDLTDAARAQVVVKMRAAIQDKRCSATTDMWTDKYRNFHYIGVTSHFFNENFEQESWGLCTPKFPCSSRTTGENIREALVREMTALGLTEDEFEQIEWVTDQGANVVKALEGMEREDCMAHCINTVLKTSLTLSYVELREKVTASNTDIEEVLEKFAEAAKLVRSCRETKTRKVGQGVVLKTLQKSIQLAKKNTFMYSATISSLLVHRKKVSG